MIASDDDVAEALGARLDELERHRSMQVESRLVGARLVELDALAVGDAVAVRRAQLVAADMLHRLGHVAEGARLAVEVNAWASSLPSVPLLARSHLVLSSLFEGAGDASSALDHAVRAIDLSGALTPARARGNYLLRLADALTATGSAAEARRRYREAEELFAAIGDRERWLNVLNNLTVLEYEIGDPAAAAATAERLLAVSGPEELNPSAADSIAQARLAVGDFSGAEEAARLGLDLWHRHGDAQAATPAELALSLAEALLRQGRLDEAEVELAGCLEICRERSLAGIRVQALRVHAELFAARGDFESAYREHREFHTAVLALRSHQQEAATRTRQALFETTEARREARTFRLQARTDILTGLPNRRYVNEELPRLLQELRERGGCLAAAIVDADHFKTVNDRFSHQVGDQVLARLGAILAGSVRAAATAPSVLRPEFAARLGGEEFLLVLSAPTPADARDRVEVVRRSIAERDWTDLADGLLITVSAGIAIATQVEDQGVLLARADAHLYNAKQRGRNCVVTEPDSP